MKRRARLQAVIPYHKMQSGVSRMSDSARVEIGVPADRWPDQA
ncbi:MAG TPA: hypothetical protein VET84_04215 [Stellaceae bacterium]|nr:hypothetical protein [Stellaceae bacterium]